MTLFTGSAKCSWASSTTRHLRAFHEPFQSSRGQPPIVFIIPSGRHHGSPPRTLVHDLGLSTRDLHHGPRIMMPAIHDPKQHAEEHDAAKNQDAVIHAFDTRVPLHGPHGPKGTEDRIRDRDDGDGDAPAAEFEGAPGDFRVRGAEALVQHDGRGEDERGVVAGHDEGDEGAEADGGADVDEGEEEVDDCRGADGVEGEVGVFVDLGSSC